MHFCRDFLPDNTLKKLYLNLENADLKEGIKYVYAENLMGLWEEWLILDNNYYDLVMQ